MLVSPPPLLSSGGGQRRRGYLPDNQGPSPVICRRSSADIEVTLGYTLTGQRRAVGFGRVLHPEITLLPAD
jgi:hypothetical protein